MIELVAQALNDGTSIAVSLTNALNAVTSNHAARLAAMRSTSDKYRGAPACVRDYYNGSDRPPAGIFGIE
jgi:phage-related minor tail protein